MSEADQPTDNKTIDKPKKKTNDPNDKTRVGIPPKRKFVTKTEFAQYLGVAPRQVSVALQRGRIQETASGRINWEQAAIDWEVNRSDSLAGTGKANNTRVVRMPSGEMPHIPQLTPLDGIDEMESLDETETVLPEAPVGTPPPKNTRAYEDYLEKIAKRQWAEIRVRKEQNELLEKDDVVAIYSAVLTALKTGIMSLPQRTTMAVTGIVKKWLTSHKIAIDEGVFVLLEKEIEQAITSESSFVLTDVEHKVSTQKEEVEKVVKRKRRK